MLFFKRNWSSLFSFLWLQLFLCYPRQCRLKSKERIGFVVVALISESLGDSAIYCRNARVLEMQNFTPAYIKGWTYVRTIFSETKFLGCIDYQIFLPMVLRCAMKSDFFFYFSSRISDNQLPVWVVILIKTLIEHYHIVRLFCLIVF